MRLKFSFIICLCFVAVLRCSAAEPSRIRIAPDGRSFIFESTETAFVPYGFNYDHDRGGRLLEDYWLEEWNTVEEDFREMKQLGANVVRIHLQFGKFMSAPDKPNEVSLNQLEKLLSLAEETGLYIDLTGLGCYHKADVPAWYDELDEKERWEAQALFWEAVSARCARSPVVFCYDLMNEPYAPGGNKRRDDWLGPAFAGKHFVQFIALETANRPRHEIARQWIERLVEAIRKHDRKRLITVGLVPNSLDRPGLTSGFIPEKVAGRLDFLAVHIYPQQGKLPQALKTLEGFQAVGKLVVIEEIFPLRCDADELGRFLEKSKPLVAGWIGFYWGRRPDEYREPQTPADQATLSWLELFQAKRNLLLENQSSLESVK